MSSDTNDLPTRQRRDAQRSLAAAQGALVGVVLGSSYAAEQDTVTVARAAAAQLTKVANDTEKRRRRESHDAGQAVAKASGGSSTAHRRAPGHQARRPKVTGRAQRRAGQALSPRI